MITKYTGAKIYTAQGCLSVPRNTSALNKGERTFLNATVLVGDSTAAQGDNTHRAAKTKGNPVHFYSAF